MVNMKNLPLDVQQHLKDLDIDGDGTRTQAHARFRLLRVLPLVCSTGIRVYILWLDGHGMFRCVCHDNGQIIISGGMPAAGWLQGNSI